MPLGYGRCIHEQITLFNNINCSSLALNVAFPATESSFHESMVFLKVHLRPDPKQSPIDTLVFSRATK
jgi:hypothetical protein